MFADVCELRRRLEEAHALACSIAAQEGEASAFAMGKAEGLRMAIQMLRELESCKTAHGDEGSSPTEVPRG
jgi:hypothetical protein